MIDLFSAGLEKELTQLRSQQSNVFTVYGQWVPEVLKQIDIEHKKGMFSAKPIGPLGRSIWFFSLLFFVRFIVISVSWLACCYMHF